MLKNMPDISIQAFDYELPDSLIAFFPSQKRDESRLLVHKNDLTSHHSFQQFPDLIPSDSLIVFNNTKVIPARIQLQKQSGTAIEIFLLKPLIDNVPTQKAMEQSREIRWECLIGNKKRWKANETLKKSIEIDGHVIVLSINWHERLSNQVQINWDSDHAFVSILNEIGKIPLPPYMERDTELADQDRYQTVFSKELGAVAAPTASLHFTTEILERLTANGIPQSYLTLHVGAGTFLPVKEEEVRNHPMHREQLIFDREFIIQLMQHEGSYVPVGTTAMRALESLYWSGIWVMENKSIPENGLIIPKEFAYQDRDDVSNEDSLRALLTFMEESQQTKWIAQTELLIMPSYRFRFCDALVTNFHQPKSTLMVLVSSLIGDAWKAVYQEAIDQKYRFLSYGDACLFFNKQQ
ncbi:S-adenosylmethionine:tRNA ribosyltransferase-isomerase [Aquirufa sp.]|jgi:S-adenosylmethionine:tRNA ribosyltransferase-isomerase|uniref:S-adenosylmethionine:tRNA ribosyltransferase-isomerase n=1 Tax=Aquirufa sp. TaxID=2676249 RepID=UPI0037C0ECB4